MHELVSYVPLGVFDDNFRKKKRIKVSFSTKNVVHVQSLHIAVFKSKLELGLGFGPSPLIVP